MGMITSLGEGKADNWAALTAGKSGIRTIQRFPIDHLKTTIAGTVDFVPVEPFCAPTLPSVCGEIACEEAVAPGRRPRQLPRALYVAVAPMEVEWSQRTDSRTRRREDEGIMPTS